MPYINFDLKMNSTVLSSTVSSISSELGVSISTVSILGVLYALYKKYRSSECVTDESGVFMRFRNMSRRDVTSASE